MLEQLNHGRPTGTRSATIPAAVTGCAGYATLGVLLGCISSPAWADKGVILSSNTWKVDVRAVEPAASPAISIAGQQLSRQKQTWARFRGEVVFECQVRNGSIEAVNPVVKISRPVKTPTNWGNLQGFSQLINIPATQLTLKPADIRQANLAMTAGFARPGCFSVNWSAQFDKKGTVFTYRINPPSGVPNPIQTPPQNVQLDENMDDALLGQTRICCCSFEWNDVENNKIQPGETPVSIGNPTETVRDEVREAVGEEQASEYLKLIGIDWYAEDISNPNPVDQRDPKTGWEGTRELKQCTYQFVSVKNPDGSFSDKIKTNGPVPAGSQTNKPVATGFTIP